MTPFTQRRWALVVLVGFIGICLMGPTADAGVRIGGGAGLIGDVAAPMGQFGVDLLSLWFVTAAVDAEVWLVPDGGPWVMPFLTVSTPLLFKATVGVAPLINLADVAMSVPPSIVALKAAVGAGVGPLELFGEAVFFMLPGQGVPSSIDELGRPIFAFGVTLGF